MVPPPKTANESGSPLEQAVPAVVYLAKAFEKVLAENQLSLSQYRLLERLVEGSTHGRTLAEWLAVKPPSVTALVDGLVKRGLVERSEDGRDRRQVTHTLTPAGERLRRDVSRQLAARLEGIITFADPAVATTMVASLADWQSAISASRSAKHRTLSDDASAG